jgi:hypothetical protein
VGAGVGVGVILGDGRLEIVSSDWRVNGVCGCDGVVEWGTLESHCKGGERATIKVGQIEKGRPPRFSASPCEKPVAMDPEEPVMHPHLSVAATLLCKANRAPVSCARAGGNSRESLFLPHRGGRSRSRYGGKGTNPLTRDCDIRHIGSNIRVQKAFSGPRGFPFKCQGCHSSAREEKALENGRRWRMAGAGEWQALENGRRWRMAGTPLLIPTSSPDRTEGKSFKS